MIARAAAAFAFAFLSLLWADDVEAGTNLLAFFTLPFAVLLATVARADFPDFVPRALAAVGLALATLFAVVGLWQVATHKLFFSRPTAVSNANTDYLASPRRCSATPACTGATWCSASDWPWRCWRRTGGALAADRADRRDVGGLLFSYSQSSMAALLLVTLALGLLTGDRRVRMAVGALAVAGVPAAAAFVTVELIDGESLNQITSDRTERVEDTTRVIEHNPLVGWASGAAARRELAGSDRPTPNFVSHTTPLTSPPSWERSGCCSTCGCSRAARA